MYVKANTTPASAPGDFVWENEDNIVEVPDDLGTQLLRIAGQFTEVLPSDPEHPDYVPPEPGEIDPPEWQGGEDDLIGVTKKPCGHEGCKNNAKPGQDYCHWHQPKD